MRSVRFHRRPTAFFPRSVPLRSLVPVPNRLDKGLALRAPIRSMTAVLGDEVVLERLG